MTHLSADERLALIESTEGPAHPHLQACARCRAEVESARAALDQARSSDVPEPSPLFWDHLSVRISERLGEEPETLRRRWRGWRVLVPSMVGVAAVVLAVWIDRDLARRPSGPALAPVPASAESPEAAFGTAGDDESWSMLGQMAGEFDVDTLSDSLGTSEGTGAERAVYQLSAEERASLVELLQSQTSQPAVHQ